jgi:ElaB/YqjD/DUF883 family membrane-anchored ribosome-binding protein
MCHNPGLPGPASPWSRHDTPLAQECTGTPSNVPHFATKLVIDTLDNEGVLAMSSYGSESTGKGSDASEQIARLREQVESLMKDRVTPAVADAAARAESAYYGAADTVRGQVESVSGKVREQPLLSILIAAAIGYVLGRATR